MTNPTETMRSAERTVTAAATGQLNVPNFDLAAYLLSEAKDFPQDHMFLLHVTGVALSRYASLLKNLRDIGYDVDALLARHRADSAEADDE